MAQPKDEDIEPGDINDGFEGRERVDSNPYAVLVEKRSAQ